MITYFYPKLKCFINEIERYFQTNTMIFILQSATKFAQSNDIKYLTLIDQFRNNYLSSSSRYITEILMFFCLMKMQLIEN
jgi:hypothetical protein